MSDLSSPAPDAVPPPAEASVPLPTADSSCVPPPDADHGPERRPGAGGPPPAPPARSGRLLFVRIVGIIGFLFALQYFVPFLLERYQYALTRGRLRAEYEVAGAGLQAGPLDELSRSYQMVAQRVAPSVVHIDVRATSGADWPEEFSRRFGADPPDAGQGSGVVIDPQGYIVTNFHVVYAATEIRVTLHDGRVLPGEVIGSDIPTDLALVKVPSQDIIAAEWGDSEALETGALVWAVGSPFGLQSTITFGIVGGKHRSAVVGDVYQDFLQTDAAVNPGNSGGPLVDARGRVVGINTAIVGEAYRGVSFAVPSSVAREVCERLKTKGVMSRGWLGVQLRDLGEADVTRRRLPNKQGALVVMVIDDPNVPHPAMEAGVKAGDVIVRWNGQAVASREELIRLIGMTDVGNSVPMIVLRNGEEVSLAIKVAERPPY